MSKIYGYYRISTQKQNIERQVRNIIKFFPDAMIIQGRKELDKLVKSVKNGDTIISDSISRMSRNADYGFRKELHINTSIYRKTLEEKKFPVQQLPVININRN